MLFTIPDLLSAEAVADLIAQLEQADTVDGKTTAGWHAKTVKQNQQLDPKHPATAAMIDQVHQVTLKHPLFQSAARPRRIHTLRFNRYSDGMAYGRHTDSALMSGFRSDLSFTLFLSDPDSYEGGELVVEGADSEQAYKLQAGSMLVYPSSSLHRVEPVVSGVRWAAIGWVQSQVRDPAAREILFELDTARRSLFAQYGKTDEFDLITKSLNNLVRRWVD
ncbi:MAG: Fe2+-dependent dioxygenase [Phormidesmis priestleyi]|uniref:Fe2+-dependent dioxygenase n=1 Tax=Phormidesmis priestleyi TaxID=268141 RepID=A0A2W4XMM1_9CYAN|nr:MAG: Fe2+-dependent dioxygenase [Phormidesmis priestleyi]